MKQFYQQHPSFTVKEPWVYGKTVEEIVSYYFRLRHRLIPYIYTCAYRANTELTPIPRL